MPPTLTLLAVPKLARNTKSFSAVATHTTISTPTEAAFICGGPPAVSHVVALRAMKGTQILTTARIEASGIILHTAAAKPPNLPQRQLRSEFHNKLFSLFHDVVKMALCILIHNSIKSNLNSELAPRTAFRMSNVIPTETLALF